MMKISKTMDSQDPTDLKHYYDEWASSYNDDLLIQMGYKVPQIAVESFVSVVLKDAKILDIGSGTGIVGEVLQQHQYRNLEALDLSKKMLEEAQRKNIYQAYHLQTLGETLELKSDTFDAIIAVSAFGPTHAPPAAFDELIRITKPGGTILFTMRDHEMPLQGAFRTKMEALEYEKKWKLVMESDPFQGFTKQNTQLTFKIFIYTTLI